MTEERKPEEPVEPAERVEDLEVPADEGENVKGGITDGTSNTLTAYAAKGKHFPEGQITVR